MLGGSYGGGSGGTYPDLNPPPTPAPLPPVCPGCWPPPRPIPNPIPPQQDNGIGGTSGGGGSSGYTSLVAITTQDNGNATNPGGVSTQQYIQYGAKLGVGVGGVINSTGAGGNGGNGMIILFFS